MTSFFEGLFLTLVWLVVILGVVTITALVVALIVTWVVHRVQAVTGWDPHEAREEEVEHGWVDARGRWHPDDES